MKLLLLLAAVFGVGVILGVTLVIFAGFCMVVAEE